MRKDLKIGLAVGGVLLAVLIVYAIVPKGKPRQELAKSDPAVQQPGEESTDPAVTDDTAEPTDVTSIDDTGTAEDPTAVTTDTGDGQTDTGTEQPLVEERDQVARSETDDPFQSDVPASAGRDTSGAAWEQLVPLMTETPEREDASSTEIAISDDTDTVSSTGTGSDDLSGAELARADGPASASIGATETLTTESDTSANDARTVDNGSSTAASGGARMHVMQRGETYSSIAKLVYGNAKYYRAIEEANPTLDPTRLRPGTEIRLPDPATVKAGGSAATGGTPAGRTIDAAKEYRVESGDSLYKISVKRFGDASRTSEIYELNKQLIGEDPSRLKVGMILKLPTASGASASSR